MNDLNTIWEYLIEYDIATEEELQLVTSINGFSENTLNDVISVRTGYEDFEQWMEFEFKKGEGAMYKVYDMYNNYTYAQGEAISELIDNWNEKAKGNFSWLLEYDETALYKEITKEAETIRYISYVMERINCIDGNDLQLTANNKIIDIYDFREK